MKQLDKLIVECQHKLSLGEANYKTTMNCDWVLMHLLSIKKEVEILNAQKEIYGHAHTQDELLIRELWTLWENLAEAGELTITSKFATKYNELKAKIK